MKKAIPVIAVLLALVSLPLHAQLPELECPNVIPPSPEASKLATYISYPVNLNTATFEELTAIQGIGDQRAAAILAYREQIGKYTSVEQIKDIRGIGDGLYAKIAPYLTV